MKIHITHKPHTFRGQSLHAEFSVAIFQQKFAKENTWTTHFFKDEYRPMPFHDFTLFGVLSLFTVGSSCIGGTRRKKRELREDNKS